MMKMINVTWVCALLGGLLFTQQALASEPLPQRLVSAGGALSEWVVLLGGEGKLVGVDSTSQHPSSLKALPAIGYQRQLAAEGILTLAPQVLLGTEEMGPPATLQQLKAAGVRVEVFSALPNVPALQVNLLRLGRLLGTEQLAAQQLADYRQRLLRQDAWISAAQRTSKAPSVLFLLGHAGSELLVAGQATTGNWLIERAGGRNLVDHRGYKTLSSEALLALDPEVLIIADRSLSGAAASAALLAHNPALAASRAVRQQRIFLLDPSLLVGGLGPRLPAELALLAAALYPAALPLTAEVNQ